MTNSFDKYIGKPIEKCVQELNNLGYNIEIIKSSKQKIKTDNELVVSVREVSDNEVIIVVGEFLINIEGRDGLV